MSEVEVNKPEEDLCTTCQEEIDDNQEAIQCDICERWEHRLCIKACHRPTTEFYKVLCASPSIKRLCSRARSAGARVP